MVWNICCSEETYVYRLDICDRFLFVFLCLLVRPDSLLFCLKWDKPQCCFLLFTSFTTGFPVLGDLSLHSCTCFLLFLASPTLVCLSHYIPLSVSQFILLSLLYSLSVFDSLPDWAFHCSITSLTGDINPASSELQTCGKSNL